MKKQTEMKLGEKSGLADGSVKKPVKKISKKTEQKKPERRNYKKIIAAASTFAICCVLLVGTAQCAGPKINKSIIEITGTPKQPAKTKAKRVKAKKRIRVRYSAFDDCNRWCIGQCSYIEIDPNQGHLYRYVCKE